MPRLTLQEHTRFFSASGKLQSGRGGCGISTCGNSKCGEKTSKLIYQRRRLTTGIDTIKMKYYRPTNPQTETQQANRTKFADAMAAWGALTDEEKAEYTERAKRRNMFGWGLYIRNYYQSH